MLKFFHERHLMGVDVLKSKGLRGALLGVEADRNPLDRPDVVYGTLLLKIGQRDMTMLLVDLDGSDRGRHFLNQRQPLFPVHFICPVDEVLKNRTS